ncbi:MAG: CDP-glucose 4,6-dehydratase [Proteobacteria bacterium]|nr:CDP-glucose 4,6-dehydratase [Pseudomonadota bacterium]HQR04005.1 CDP-glucose 4,6-dehydratase [Rhodocyclaceae bacterium]
MENLGLNPEFWRGRTVLVTGHTGFKGSWLCLWLLHWGARVTGYALPPAPGPSLFQSLGLAQKMDSVFGDVRDATALSAVARGKRFDTVFHLAAQPLVRASYDDPVSTFATNVMGTVHLLDAFRDSHHPPAIVVVTSDKCYENREWPWPYRENEALGGHDPYSASKAATEIAAASYRRSFPGCAALATARAGNVIGGGDWAADRLVPDLVRALQNNTAPVLRNPDAVRPWQHVLDALHGYILLAQALTADTERHATAWNFGPGETDLHPVRWVAERLCAQWGGDLQWKPAPDATRHEARLLRLDSSLARTRLGWAPRWNTARALETTAQWYRHHHHHAADIADFTLSQLEHYLQ